MGSTRREVEVQESYQSGQSRQNDLLALSRRANQAHRDVTERKTHVRRVRKKQAMRRYEQDFPNLRRGQSNLTDFEGDQDAMYCFSAEDDGESVRHTIKFYKASTRKNG